MDNAAREPVYYEYVIYQTHRFVAEPIEMEWELNWITGLNPKHPDFTKIVKDRLASLKGGDV